MLSKHIAWLTFFLVNGIGNRTLLAIHEDFPDISCALNLSDEELISRYKIKEELIEELRNPEKKIKEELRLIKKYGVKIITIEDEEYPSQLKDISDPPCVLYVMGDISCVQEDSIAIVGTRAASSYAKTSAEKIARDLVEYGVVIISGFARGVDTAAHTGALNGLGKTVAVLGSGIVYLYPEENSRLVPEVLKYNGCIISEFSMTTPPQQSTFPRRNRIISGLSKRGVVVVEAALQSGSLITARYAREQNKSVYVVPGNIFSPNSKGSNKLLKDGAILIESAKDILGINLETKSDEPRDFTEMLLNDEKEVYALIEYDSISIDELSDVALKKGLTLPKTVSILMALEIKGFIKALPGKRFVRV